MDRYDGIIQRLKLGIRGIWFEPVGQPFETVIELILVVCIFKVLMKRRGKNEKRTNGKLNSKTVP